MSNLLAKPINNTKPKLEIEQYDRCNTCTWAVLDVRVPGAIICHGAPPTVVMIPSAQGMQPNALRPVMEATSRACSLHKKKSAILM